MYPLALSVVVLLCVIAGGALLTISNHPHWFIRGWDFPHVQMVFITVVAALIYAICSIWIFDPASINSAWHWTIATLSVLIVAGLSYGILPYTRLLPVQTKLATKVELSGRIRMVISNVEMENDQYDLWMGTVSNANPDLVILLEVNKTWLEKIRPFTSQYPFAVSYPQDNWYGMLLISRFPILNHEIRFRVTDDVPSIDARLELPSGEQFRVLAVHPRPPEPIRDNDSAQRDAELTLYGLELQNDPSPVIIGGDLNDVAWSSTTRLFLRLSKLLDPRRGRGFYNSFSARHWWMRFPLDHVFHSRHFTLHNIARLGYVGSDHFPMLLELQCEPSRKSEQYPLEQRESDDAEAEKLIQRV